MSEDKISDVELNCSSTDKCLSVVCYGVCLYFNWSLKSFLSESVSKKGLGFSAALINNLQTESYL